MAKDPYQILGIDKSADEKAIKSAYRKLAKELHPDLNPGDATLTDRFSDVTEAYDLLSDPEERAAFDKGEIDGEGNPTAKQSFYRDHAEGPQGYRYYQYSSSDPESDINLDDILGGMFGQGQRNASWFTERSSPTLYVLDVEFLDAVNGKNLTVTLPDGRQASVNVPAGTDSGHIIPATVTPSAKEANQHNTPMVRIRVNPHPIYSRQRNDIHMELPIGFHESILGSKVQVPTIHGPVQMKLPKGASSGKKLRLKGKGISGGDQYATLKIVMPEHTDEDLEDAIRLWAERSGFNPRKGGKSHG